MAQKSLFSSHSVEWDTPQGLFDACTGSLGLFEVDSDSWEGQ